MNSLTTITSMGPNCLYSQDPCQGCLSNIASEAADDLNFELSGLNNLCFNASLASILLQKPFFSQNIKSAWASMEMGALKEDKVREAVWVL